MKRFAVLLFSFLVSFSASAQTTTPPRVTGEIIVTASSVPETVESTPASVTVVTRRDIDERAARDVADVLREVPGLTVSRTGSLGKTSSVFIRGASSKQTLVLWNGIELNDPYFSGYNWGQFSTAGVERVEVARGPFSSLYGADAVGGVVNIITTGGADRVDADLAAGGRGLFNAVASVSRRSYYATVEHRQDDGFAPNDDDIQNAFIGGFTHWTRSATIGIAGRVSTYDLGVPRNTNAFATAFIATPHYRQNGMEWQLGIPMSAELGAVHLDARLASTRRDDHYEDPDAFLFGDTKSSRRNGRVAGRMSTPFGTIVAGGEVERSEAKNRDSFGLDLDNHRRSSNALFVEDRVSRVIGAGRLEVSVGARRDHYATFGSATSPRLAVAWFIGGRKFRAAYGQAFRAPQIGELYLPFFGNPDLKAERSRSTEIGYDHFFDADGMLSLTLFDNRFRELIAYDVVQSRFNNIGQAHSRGLEIAASERRGSWSAGLTYTYLRATEEPSGEQLVRRPKHSGALSVGYQPGPAAFELVVVRVGSRPDLTDIFPFGSVVNASYTKADLTLRWLAGSYTPYVKIENLTNTRYEEVFGYPSPTRRALAGVRYSR